MLESMDNALIRKLHSEGWGVKRLARELHHSKTNIREALRWDGTEPKYTLTKPKKRPVVTDKVEGRVRDILLQDKKAPRKQRHSARKIQRILLREGTQVGASTVRQLVRRLRMELRGLPAVTVPLVFDPGEEAQVDWGYAEVVMNGEPLLVGVFLATLCYSRRTFIMATPSQNLESFLEAHVQAFEHWGGVPERIAYDNLATAVKRILGDGSREENPTFLQFRTAHGFETRFCSPGLEGAHEKGRVEKRVGDYRAELLVPVPKVVSFQELNQMLLEQAAELEEFTLHPEVADRCVQQVFEDEQRFLKALPAARWRCCDVTILKVDGQARVRYDKVLYSLPCEYGRRPVEVRGYWNRVEFYDGAKLIKIWPRSYIAKDERYDYRHYLRLLKRTPGVTLNGKPFRQMPEPLSRYRKEVMERLDRRTAARTLAAVLLLILEHGEQPVMDAVELALLTGTVDAEAVRALLRQLQEEPPPRPPRLDLTSRSDLAGVAVSPPNLGRYDTLVEEALIA